jgi:hypothetical protein
MFKDLDVVVLVVGLPALGLLPGDAGTIVDLYEDGQSFMVEFSDSLGRMVAMEVLTPAQVRPLGPNEVLIGRAKAA